jgi:hypothetical protein
MSNFEISSLMQACQNGNSEDVKAILAEGVLNLFFKCIYSCYNLKIKRLKLMKKIRMIEQLYFIVLKI